MFGVELVVVGVVRDVVYGVGRWRTAGGSRAQGYQGGREEVFLSSENPFNSSKLRDDKISNRKLRWRGQSDEYERFPDSLGLIVVKGDEPLSSYFVAHHRDHHQHQHAHRGVEDEVRGVGLAPG